MIACTTAGSVCPTSMVHGDQTIRHEPAELEPCHRRRERADAQRIEEVGDCSERDGFEPWRGAAGESGAEQRHRIDDYRKCERDQESRKHKSGQTTRTADRTNDQAQGGALC